MLVFGQRDEVVTSMIVRLVRSIEIVRIAKTAGFDTIYVDLDDDGKLDANEPFAVTDAAGNYTIANVAPGGYL